MRPRPPPPSTCRPAPTNSRTALYSYGEITAIKLNPRAKCAFVEYATHGQAKLAAESKFHSLEIKVRFWRH